MPREELPENPEYYRKIPSGFRFEVDGYRIEPMTYQPTPKGLIILSQHYKNKYGIDIRIIDQSDVVEKGDNLKYRFEEFKRFLEATHIEEELTDGKQVGFILSHGFNHVIPLIISLDKDKNKVMTIFDSSSGSRVKGYHIIANMMNDYTLLLNKGTRQSDGYSCSNDAIATLKDALRMPNLAQYLLDYKIETTEQNVSKDTKTEDRRPVFFTTPLTNPDKFKIFLMPEELLKTAQNSKFVTESIPETNRIITKSNKTLEQKRNENVTTVSFNRNPEVEIPINNYLHEKGYKYAKIICNNIEMAIPPSSEPSPSRGTSPVIRNEEELLKI